MKTHSDSLNVLFLSAGRRGELLRLFGEAKKSLGLRGNLLAVDIDPLAPALRFADKRFQVPRLDHPAFPDFLLKLCRDETVHLVFPLIDPDIPILAALKSRLAEGGTRAVVVDPVAAEITRDKRKTLEFFSSLGLPTPQTTWEGRQTDFPIDFPLFVKPARGSAGQNCFRVNNREELAFFRRYVPDAMVQEYLPGAEITADVVCDEAGRLLGICLRERREVRHGEVSKGVTLRRDDIFEACQRIAAALPAKGPITVQCILKEGAPLFTEINARMGGGFPLAVAAGMEAPRCLLASAAGREFDLPPLGSYREGLWMTRYDESFFVASDDLPAVWT